MASLIDVRPFIPIIALLTIYALSCGPIRYLFKKRLVPHWAMGPLMEYVMPLQILYWISPSDYVPFVSEFWAFDNLYLEIWDLVP